MDRRQFVESFSAVCLSAQISARLNAMVLNSALLAEPSVPASEEQRPILPIPAKVRGLQKPEVSLNGLWRTAPMPRAEFWKPNLDVSQWSHVDVPCEFVMQGITIVPDVEYPCRRTVAIPGEFAGHRIFIRFDGIYCYARVWVNGVLVREHSGGFTSWDAEITKTVTPGTDAELVVGITDRSDDISKGSYYAKHSIAGIIRGVRLFAVPMIYLDDLAVSASYDPQRGGTISLHASLSSSAATHATLRLVLRNASGDPVTLQPAEEQKLSAAEPLKQDLQVATAKPWDGEHPNLYSLEIAVNVAGQTIATVERTIGFRSVERAGNQLLVNGRSVKLHGVCRHSIHPLYGRAVPPEFDEKDAILLREANVNFVRTSHYPPTETFLDACDRYGIYVEEETAVCWSTENSTNPALKENYLRQFREMIARDRHHPCVLFWSLANESTWGGQHCRGERLRETAGSKSADHFQLSRDGAFGHREFRPVE